MIRSKPTGLVIFSPVFLSAEGRVNKVHYGLMISYLLETKMHMVDRGEEVTDSAYLPYNPSKGRVFKLNPSVRIPSTFSQERIDRLEKCIPEKEITTPAPPTPVEVTAEREDARQERQRRRQSKMEQYLKGDKTQPCRFISQGGSQGHV